MRKCTCQGKTRSSPKKLKESLEVFVGIPLVTRGDRYSDFLPRALEAIRGQKSKIRIWDVYVTPELTKDIGEFQGPWVGRGINLIIDEFLKTPCSHVWIVNADTVVPPDALENLIRLDVDLASGVEPTHKGVGRTSVTRLVRGRMVPYSLEQLKGRVVGEHETVATGNFCMLAKRRLFKYLKYGESVYGSEVKFYTDAQRLGYTVRVHGGVVCGHLPEWPLEKMS